MKSSSATHSLSCGIHASVECLRLWLKRDLKKIASMTPDVRECGSCIRPFVRVSAWFQVRAWECVIFAAALYSVANVHTPSSFPPSVFFFLSLYPCSTRKQNYMMNFARQTGMRHYYSRKRRALQRRAWTQRVGISSSDVPTTHQPATHHPYSHPVETHPVDSSQP